jgi:hypothetical protein
VSSSRVHHYFSEEIILVGSMTSDDIEISSLLVINISGTIETALQTAIESLSSDNTQTVIITIDELFQPIDKISLDKLSEASSRPFVIAIQCVVDGSFTIVWKLKKLFSLVSFDCIACDDLHDLCRFVVNFLCTCLKFYHPGESKNGKKW